MFYQHNVNGNVSNVAQRKLAGPITQRSEDQNLALLVIVLSIKMFKGHLLSISFSYKANQKKYPVDTNLHWKTPIESAIQSTVISWVQRSSCEDIGFQGLKDYVLTRDAFFILLFKSYQSETSGGF